MCSDGLSSGVVVCDLPKILKLVPVNEAKYHGAVELSVGACRLQCCLGRLLRTKMAEGFGTPKGIAWHLWHRGSLNRNSRQIRAGTHVKDKEGIRHGIKKTVNDDAPAPLPHALFQTR